MPRPTRSGIALAVVGLATAGVVGATIARRPPPTSSAAPAAAAVAVHGANAWRWTGSSECAREDDAATSVEHLVDGRWQEAPVPLTRVRQLSFTDGARGLALGADEACRPRLASTEDGGRTWRSVVTRGAVQAASRSGDVMWAVVRRDAERSVVIRRASVDAEDIVVDVPCRPGDGEPALVEAVDATSAWVVCQDARSFRRLLLRTADAGANWERRASGAGSSGVVGLGQVVDFSVGVGPRGWLLMSTATCAEGDLRHTTNTGLTWQPVACLSTSAPLHRVLALDLTPAGSGIVVGVRSGATVTLVTSDGGRSWRPAP